MQINNGRNWSNKALKELAMNFPRFDNAINVSGFLDSDKAGNIYKNYFKAQNYDISRYLGDSAQSNPNTEILIDLDSDINKINKSYLNKYDLVFSHTVLEHVKNPFNAFKIFRAIMAPSSLLVNVVPFIYKFHFSTKNYGDYWRYTPHGIEELHKSSNLILKDIRIGPRNSFEKYIISVGTNDMEAFNDFDNFYDQLNNRLGEIDYYTSVKNLLNKISNSIKARI